MAATVRDIMDADPVTVTPEADVETVVRALREHELPGVPVVNSSGRCLGIITESDLVLPGDEGDLHLPHFIELFGGIVFLESMHHFQERLERATASKARDLMTEDPVTIGPDAGVGEAGRLIARSGHNRLPVVDDDGRLLGVVTRVDVLDALTRE
ncbi:MAG TPA: CBS domain-containing protein [Solirubrobacteraceae bacterium]|nr:CBS domain-containing protein [Solirubrobacteraceae bacterium]